MNAIELALGFVFLFMVVLALVEAGRLLVRSVAWIFAFIRDWR